MVADQAEPALNETPCDYARFVATPWVMKNKSIAIVGAGPAGLSAAETAAEAGLNVTLYDAMPAPARKLLLAGKSGLNLTRNEAPDDFVPRYGAAVAFLKPALDGFGATDVRAWADGLGAETYVGSSGRVFPKVMKASPLLRAWLKRLDGLGVTLKTRHRWIGFDAGSLVFETPDGRIRIAPDAALLALGGASYPRLGSDAAWVSLLCEKGVKVVPLKPSNCGFDVDWSPVFVSRFAGQPVKAVTATSVAGTMRGEFMVTAHGIEGGLVYAHSSALRAALDVAETAVLMLDLVPDRSHERLVGDLARQPGKASFANRLRKGAGLDGVKAGLLRERVPDAGALSVEALAARIKALPLAVKRPRPIEEAISSAGGIALAELDAGYMLNKLPGVFAAGEMLDWDAPTGGYLLTGCFATGRAAGRGLVNWLEAHRKD